MTLSTDWPQSYEALPFMPRGRSREGVDCYGLIVFVYREQLGIILPSFSDRYEDTRDRATSEALFCANAAPWLPVDDRRDFDVLWLRVEGRASHVGLTAPYGRVLHGLDGHGVVCEPERRWARKIVGRYRHELMAEA